MAFLFLFEGLKDFTTGTKLRTILSSLLVALLIPITLFANTQSWELRRKAAEEPRLPDTEDQLPKPEYAPGEALVKFRQGVEIKVPEKEQQPFSVEALETESSTKPLAGFLKQQGVTQLEKVFKGASDPQTELDKFKQKFPQRKINEEELLKIDLSRTYKLTFDNEVDIPTKIQELSQDPNIEYAEPNYIAKLQLVPNDPHYLDPNPPAAERELPYRQGGWDPDHDYQWNLKKINAEGAWDVTTGSEDVVVAVIDTGIDRDHEDLSDVSIYEGYNYVSPSDPPIDDHGHGTHETGIIATSTNNNLGIAGINWRASIVPLKAFDYRGIGWNSHMSAAIRYAADSGAKVINLSAALKTSQASPPQTLKDAVDYALAKDVFLAAAAGNSAEEITGVWPAAYEPVIAVSATNRFDELANYSNFGEGIDLAAPGGTANLDVLSLKSARYNFGVVVGSNYLRGGGTSAATPHVAGLAALVLANDSSLSAKEVENVLKNSAVDLGDPGFDYKFGYGRINASKALQEMNTQPVIKASISLPSDMRIGSRIEILGTASAEDFDSYLLEYSTEADPYTWRSDGITLLEGGRGPVFEGTLGVWELPSGLGEVSYSLRLTVNTRTGLQDYAIRRLVYDPRVKMGWPVFIKKVIGNSVPIIPNLSDVDEDGKQEITFALERRAYLLREDGKPYPGWEEFYPSGSEPPWWGRIIYPPVVANTNDASAGKEIVLGISSYPTKIKAFGLGTNQVFSKELYTPNTRSNDSLGVLSKEGELSFVFGSTEEGTSSAETRVTRINGAEGQTMPGWPAVLYLGNSYAPRTVLGNVVTRKDLNVVASHVIPPGWYGDGDAIVVLNLEGDVLADWSVPEHRGGNVLLGDVDGDGIKEIVTDTKRGGNIEVAIFKGDGSEIGYFVTRSSERIGLVLADFHNTGKAEIFVDDNRGQLTVLDGVGSVVAQGQDPYPLERPYPMEGGLRSGVEMEYFNAAVGDLNGDGKKEIVKLGKRDDGTFAYHFYTVDGLGILADTFPYFPISHEAFAPVSIGDLDNDGEAEIILVNDISGYFAVYVLELDQTMGILDWPQYLHDERHTGAYESPVEPVCTPGSLLDGDTNCDCVVNIFDLVRVGTNYGKTENNPGWDPLADIVADGRINIFDLVKVGVNYGRTCP